MPTTQGAFTIEQFAARLRSRKVSAADLVEHCLRRIEQDNGSLNAFIHVMAEEARREAAVADRDIAAGRDRGPLHGVPVALKDLIDVAGVPTTAASRVREGHIAATDAPIVTALRKAGAIIIGKTNLDEFAFGTTSENSAFGPVRNPHDPARSPGGSSGGSAVSVAAGMALAAIGTDTGGSIRIPAAVCGIVGLKPTYDEVCADGVVPLARSFDHVGPFARTVADAALVYQALTATSTSIAPANARDAQSIRLAIPRAYFCDLLDGDVRARFDQSIADLRAAGVQIIDTSIAHAPETPAIYMHIHSSEGAQYHAKTLESASDEYTRGVRLRLEVGRCILAEDYARAMRGREILRQEVEAALAGVDALVLPAVPIPAPPIGAESVMVDTTMQPVRAMMLRNTHLFNVTGHPAISMPCGMTSNGLPCGLELVGRRFETSALLGVALGCETVLSVR
jgi:aspartyl-tRNA(Asn)/glutamyl-tRNA(Gln) amidotransferase subunit A